LRTILALLFFCALARADFSYESRIQFEGNAPVTVTRAIKGNRMAILTHKHTDVIDLDAETITQIDYAKKTYAVIPFSKWKKILDDAAAHAPHETGFHVAKRPGGDGAAKPIGVLHADESVIDIAGASGALSITVDTWVETIPGYEQMRDFIDRLGAKLGYTFAAGLAEQALRVPDSLPGLDEAIKEMNQSRGAPIEATIKIASPQKTIAEVSIRLAKLGGGAQLAAIFNLPDGFKKVDGNVP
jgi:hypothetical protein